MKGRFCSGVFSTKEIAEEWIKKYSLSGVLTVYSIDEAPYDLAIRMGHFKPQKVRDFTPEFIGGFTSASQDHFHYEDGVLVSE